MIKNGRERRKYGGSEGRWTIDVPRAKRDGRSCQTLQGINQHNQVRANGNHERTTAKMRRPNNVRVLHKVAHRMVAVSSVPLVSGGCCTPRAPSYLIDTPTVCCCLHCLID